MLHILKLFCRGLKYKYKCIRQKIAIDLSQVEEKKQLTDTAQKQTDFQAEEGPGRVHSLHLCVCGVGVCI